jgi:peptidoglycan/LPS O-acetylase OafA/YrhL
VKARRLAHINALDGLRGVAILMVLGGHAFGRRGGLALGVDVFFVLSGFLITSLLLSEHDRYGHIALRSFYRRRAFRLLPALYAQIAILIVVLGALVLAGRDGRLLTDFLSAAATASIYLGNLAAAFHVPTEMPHRYGYYWSLAQEEQFYLLWPPLLIWLLARKRHRAIYVVAIAIALGSALAQIALWRMGATRTRLWFAPDTHLTSIACGCLIGVAYTYARLPLRMLRLLAPLALIACITIVAVPPFDYRWLYEGSMTAFSVACAILLLAACSGAAGWLAKPLEISPLRWTGKISYSLYLWHIPLLVAFGLAGIPLAFGVAAASRHYVEEPFLRRRRRPQGAAKLQEPPGTPEAATPPRSEPIAYEAALRQ